MIPRSFFFSDDVVTLAKKMLGCTIWTRSVEGLTSGVIVETEAYDGLCDRACHAFGGRRTDRTRIFYDRGGILYTYLCYGIHTLSNIITGPAEVPQAVLIRAVKPCRGLPLILKRRHHEQRQANTANGPGLVSQALGITRSDNGTSLAGSRIWLTFPTTTRFHTDTNIIASHRVGVEYAGDDARRPWRFRIKNSPWCSPAK